ncbi:hypothetical protein DID88_008947 [Monilinia fructigena]|uniref:Uncharacterized protein n=1 Tax=Monilinia fructigena TaxID=38457 RepID=A0A395J7K3_9HELO|nr:hypothetical protein DID88_008947 [Monilinia fructigena]
MRQWNVGKAGPVLRCGEEVKGCKAWGGDVVIAAPLVESKEISEKPKGRKSVEFQEERMRTMDPVSHQESTSTNREIRSHEDDGDSSGRDSQLGVEETYDEEEDQGLEEYEDEAE